MSSSVHRELARLSRTSASTALTPVRCSKRIEQHRGVAGRQHEAVAVGPDRIVRVEAQKSLPQRVGHRRHAPSACRDARIGLLDRIHRQGADGVDAELIDGPAHFAPRAHGFNGRDRYRLGSRWHLRCFFVVCGRHAIRPVQGRSARTVQFGGVPMVPQRSAWCRRRGTRASIRRPAETNGNEPLIQLAFQRKPQAIGRGRAHAARCVRKAPSALLLPALLRDFVWPARS